MEQLKQIKKGFTLLELLIVIAIMAILASVIVMVLNPAETMKKARDVQRISDLATVKTAIGLYLTDTASPYLSATSSALNTKCYGATTTPTIFYSQTGVSSCGASFVCSGTAASKVDGTGWIPVYLSSLTGGSPISNLPVDPVNTVSATATTTDLVYRYACNHTSLSFEINAKLESTAYTSTDNKLTKDGGNNDLLYEVGTSLTVLPATADF